MITSFGSEVVAAKSADLNLKELFPVEGVLVISMESLTPNFEIPVLDMLAIPFASSVKSLYVPAVSTQLAKSKLEYDVAPT